MLPTARTALVQDAAGQTTAPAGPAPGAPAAAPASPFTGMLVPLILCAGVFYLLVLGPERKQRKKREEMLKNISKGDKVMTSGGLYATVAQVQEDVITLQIADGVRARFSRSAVQSIVSDEASATDKAGERVLEKAGEKK
jgi:preprotein translocase subunit YajC